MGWFETEEELERVLDYLRQQATVLLRERIQQQPPFITFIGEIPSALRSHGPPVGRSTTVTFDG